MLAISALTWPLTSSSEAQRAQPSNY